MAFAACGLLGCDISGETDMPGGAGSISAENAESIALSGTDTSSGNSPMISESDAEGETLMPPDDFSEMGEQASDEIGTDTNTFTFVDVNGDKHETPLDADAKLHSFDWSNLSGEGLGLKYEDENYTSRIGIDVSFYQGDIDWEKVKAAGVEFVIIRVGYRGYTEGKIRKDKKFRTYLKGAKNAGLDVGVYFYSQAISKKEAKKEARFVIKKLKEAELRLPIVYDAETGGAGARTAGMSAEQLTDNAIAFCNVVKKNGYDCMIYANMIWEAEHYEMSRLNDIKMWYADYEPAPQSPYQMDFWQFTCEGRVDGIDADVDLDLQFILKDAK